MGHTSFVVIDPDDGMVMTTHVLLLCTSSSSPASKAIAAEEFQVWMLTVKDDRRRGSLARMVTARPFLRRPFPSPTSPPRASPSGSKTARSTCRASTSRECAAAHRPRRQTLFVARPHQAAAGAARGGGPLSRTLPFYPHRTPGVKQRGDRCETIPTKATALLRPSRTTPGERETGRWRASISRKDGGTVSFEGRR